MGAEALIHKLATLGVELRADGDRLLFRPADQVTPDLLAELRARKAELLAALAAGVAVADGFKGGDVDVGNERPAVIGKGDEEAAVHHGHKIGVADGVGLPAGRDDAERLERLAVKDFGDVFRGHAGIVSPDGPVGQDAPVDADACRPVPTDRAGGGDALAAIRAAGRRKLAGLGWIVGDRLAALPEGQQGLVMPREGWTPASWAEHMRYLAGRCAELHPDRADLYRRASAILVAEARRIERGGPA